MSKTEVLYEEILDILNGIEAKNELPDSDELSTHVMELKDQLLKERQDYIVSHIVLSFGEKNISVSLQFYFCLKKGSASILW